MWWSKGLLKQWYEAHCNSQLMLLSPRGEKWQWKSSLLQSQIHFFLVGEILLELFTWFLFLFGISLGVFELGLLYRVPVSHNGKQNRTVALSKDYSHKHMENASVVVTDSMQLKALVGVRTKGNTNKKSKEPGCLGNTLTTMMPRGLHRRITMNRAHIGRIHIT